MRTTYMVGESLPWKVIPKRSKAALMKPSNPRPPVLLVHRDPLTAPYVDSDIEHLWRCAYRLGFYRGGPVILLSFYFS